MAKTAPFSFRLDPDLKAELDTMAEEENRSLTNMIETILKEAVEARRAKRRRK